ncbi:hypothetical protein TIFTF001_008598 [Ficus carica]|uniref:Uncharacterized protein n=1 Tax=Ficus carica TaxID=3494 RepID=A0AA87ZTP3_FICCA|nr:hypothetical protein TIFTF001_008598 [Ficus carica]
MEFPQPTRPVNSYIDDTSSSSSLNNTADENTITEWRDKPAQRDYYDAPATTTTITKEEEDRKDIEKVLRSKISEVYEKLPEKIRHQLKMKLEDILGQVISKRRSSSISQENFTRGLQGYDDQKKEELSRRLERFKIRTLDPTGEIIVKEHDETKR